MNTTSVHNLTLLAVSVIISVAFSACSARPGLLSESVIADDCVLLPASATPKDTLVIAVSPAALNGSLASSRVTFDRLLYLQLFDNLISAACDGRTIPSISTTWERLESGTEWRFQVGSEIRDAHGLFLFDRSAGFMPDDDGSARLSVDSVRAADGYSVDVFVRSPSPRVPRVLASPLFPVMRRGPDSDWFFRLPGDTLQQQLRDSTLSYTPSNPGAPVLSVLVSSDQDERDLLSRGIDLMTTSDTDVIAYARRTTEYESIPLPWETVYVLVSTTRFIEKDKVSSGVDSTFAWWPGFASGAVRADARAPATDYWWQDLRSCYPPAVPETVGAPRPRASFYSSGQRRILFHASDQVARDIAERVVALSSEDQSANEATAFLTENIPGLAPTNAQISTRSVNREEMRASLTSGTDFAYVVALRIRPYDLCGAAALLLEEAPWLGGKPADLTTALLPVTETRPHLIYSGHHPALRIDWFGNIRMLPPAGRQ